MASPAQAGESTLDKGPYYLEDVLLVGAGDVLTIGSGVTVTGPGRLEVHGVLLIAGEPARPTHVSVPIQLLGNGTSRFEHARVWAVNGTAVTLQGGGLEARHVLFEGNTVGLDAARGSEARLDNVTFRSHDGAALQVRNGSRVALDHASFTLNERAIGVRGAALLEVASSQFRGNGIHLALEPGAADAPPGAVRLRANDFGPLLESADPRPALLLHGSDAARVQTVESVGNRYHGHDIAIRLAGPGMRLESRNDSIVDNDVGIAIANATLDLEGAILANRQDFTGVQSGAVSVRNVTYLAAPAAALELAPPSTGGGAPTLWLVGLGAVLAGGTAYVLLRPRGGVLRAPTPAPEPRADPAPAPEAEAAPGDEDPLAGLSAQERRVVDEIAARPGSAQAAIAQRLGFSRQALHYHVKKLESRGLVRKVAQGRETHCYLAPKVADRLAAPARRPPE